MQKVDKFSIYDAQDIRIFCGDYFDLEAKHLNTT
jgi:hypothetical protein